MSPRKEGAPAPATQGKKRPKGRLERINGRFHWFQEWADGINKLLVASGPTAPDGVKKEISDTAELVKTIAEACGGASEKFLALHKAKWEPKNGRDVFAAGSLVMMKPRFVDGMAAVYEKNDLFSLRVVSLHGKMAKVEIFRNNLVGEKFVVPCRQLQTRSK